MEKRKRYREYWKKRLNYDYEKEYNIYKYLCGGMRRKWQEKRIPKERRFEAYSTWKEYVISRYETSELDKLKEFHKYLNSCSRIEKSVKGIINAFLLPLCVAFITTILTNSGWTKIFSAIQEIMSNIIEEYGENPEIIILSIVVETILIVLLVVVVALLIFVPSRFIMKDILKTAISEGEIEAFYEDYIEIIDEVIAQKETEIKKSKTQ